MRTALLLLLASMVFAGEEKTDPLERLAKTGVASPGVGFSGRPSEFYGVYVELRASEDAGLVDRLLKDERPVFRCMGLNLLVVADGKAAVPELMRRLADREPVSLQLGCMGSTSTVGGVAHLLLHTPNLLSGEKEGDPLLGPDALLALDLEVLNRDDTFAIHERTAVILGQVLVTRPVKLPMYRKMLANRTDVAIVKGLGRTLFRGVGTWSAEVERSLVRVASDAEAKREVRFAALAGIAQGGTEKARGALVTNRGLLKNPVLAEFVQRCHRRDALREALHDAFGSGKTKSLAPLERSQAGKNGEPAALLVLDNVIYDARIGERPAPDWVLPALDRIVARAEAGFPAWDPDADLRYRLEAFLWSEGRWLKKHADLKVMAALEARIANLVAE